MAARGCFSPKSRSRVALEESRLSESSLRGKPRNSSDIVVLERSSFNTKGDGPGRFDSDTKRSRILAGQRVIFNLYLTTFCHSQGELGDGYSILTEEVSQESQ